MWNPFRWLSPNPLQEEPAFGITELLSEAPIPCLWLFGKTGSGKTSIIRYLTGAHDAEIGSGFRPQTRHSRQFNFPDVDLPIVQFLDTRGLGEAGYDPAEDVARFHDMAHLVIVVIRATDQATAAVVDPLKQIRKDKPQRPVLLVVTCLHDAYAGQQHPEPDLFNDKAQSIPAACPADLARCLEAHYARFQGLIDRVALIDLTPVEYGFEDTEFGGDHLKRTILDMLPSAYRQTLLQMEHVRGQLRDLHLRKSDRIILSYSVVAASAAAVPVPWIDIPFVVAIQSHLLHRLATENHRQFDKRALLHLSGTLGGRLALRLGIRELLKFIPWIGVAANAAAAFAFTYASGKAATWYFIKVNEGHVPSAEELRHVYRDQLEIGARLWKTRQEEPTT